MHRKSYCTWLCRKLLVSSRLLSLTVKATHFIFNQTHAKIDKLKVSRFNYCVASVFSDRNQLITHTLFVAFSTLQSVFHHNSKYISSEKMQLAVLFSIHSSIHVKGERKVGGDGKHSEKVKKKKNQWRMKRERSPFPAWNLICADGWD